ncbi:MAG: NYN domain-containing protein [Actinomycetota bacterium]|nr:NYN domain-containing protein [Actinomycetota bacterium]
MADKLSIFIDGSNFYHALKEIHGRADLNFEEFIKLLLPDPRDPKKSLRIPNPVKYYNSVIDSGRYPESFKKQQRFFAHLQQLTDPRFIIDRSKIKYYGRLQYKCRKCEAINIIPMQKCPNCGKVETLQNSSEKGVDVKIAVDMVNGAVNNDYDVALIISEDSDFVPAIKAVKRYKKKVELVVLQDPTRKRGRELIQCGLYWTHYVKPVDLMWIKGAAPST